MFVLDNQQETARWLIGIIDGEGSILNCTRGYDSDIRIVIVNTNYDILQECQKYYNSIGVESNLYEDPPRKNWKISYKLRVTGKYYCTKLYENLLPYLECRKEQYNHLTGSSEILCETSLTPDLYWLIGIWQGEGHFGLKATHQTKNVKYYPECIVGNTNDKIIKKIELTLKELGLAFHVKDFLGRKAHHRNITIISVGGMFRVKRFLEKTKGLWIGIRDIKRTNLLSEFIESRLSKFVILPYSDRENSIYQAMKDLNKTGRR